MILSLASPFWQSPSCKVLIKRNEKEAKQKKYETNKRGVEKRDEREEVDAYLERESSGKELCCVL